MPQKSPKPKRPAAPGPTPDGARPPSLSGRGWGRLVAPAARPSALIDTRVIYRGHCPDQLSSEPRPSGSGLLPKLPDARADRVYVWHPFPTGGSNGNRNCEVFWGEMTEPRPSEAVEILHRDLAQRALWCVGPWSWSLKAPFGSLSEYVRPSISTASSGSGPLLAFEDRHASTAASSPSAPRRRARRPAPLQSGAGVPAGQDDHCELAFMDHWHPIQVKQKDRVGRPDIDTFEAVMTREDRTKGFFVAFDYSSYALTVREIVG